MSKAGIIWVFLGLALGASWITKILRPFAITGNCAEPDAPTPAAQLPATRCPGIPLARPFLTREQELKKGTSFEFPPGRAPYQACICHTGVGCCVEGRFRATLTKQSPIF